MVEYIEHALKTHILKSFKIGRRISADEFNKNIIKNKMKNKKIDNDIDMKNTSINKEKPIEVDSNTEYIEKTIPNDLPEVDDSNEVVNKNTLQDKIIDSVKYIHESIFKFIGNSDLDKASKITIMNIISKMVYQTENITEKDIKKYIKYNKNNN